MKQAFYTFSFVGNIGFPTEIAVVLSYSHAIAGPY